MIRKAIQDFRIATGMWLIELALDVFPKEIRHHAGKALLSFAEDSVRESWLNLRAKA